VQRWLKFVKYLRDFGWESVVFTPENPEMPVEDKSLLWDIPDDCMVVKLPIEEPYRFYKKLTGKRQDQKIQTAFLSESGSKNNFLENLSIWIRGNLFIPDARKSWIKPSVKFLVTYLKEHKIDAVVTTGPPHSMHMIGYQLKTKLHIPWLADFRDPWTNIDYYEQLKLTKHADQRHHQLEKQVLTEANAVTVVSPGMVDDFMGKVDRKYHFIPNGYDTADTQPGVDVIKSEKFTLSHIGSLTKTRNPENLWNVLSELVHENKPFAEDLEIMNVGKIDFQAIKSIKQAGLEAFMTPVDYMPHEQVIHEQKSASLLLLLINNTPNAKLILTGKIFEYLVSGTPVACIGPPDGNAAQIIKSANCGQVFGFDDERNLRKYLLASYERFKNKELISKCSGTEQYARRNLTGRMAEVLTRITA